VQARLAFAILLALGLADLAVLNVSLAPQLATLDGPKPIASSNVKPSGTPVRPTVSQTVATVAPPPTQTTVAAVSASAKVVEPPASAIAPPTSSSVAVVTPPPTSTEPPPVATPPGAAMPDLIFDLDSHLVGNPTFLSDLKRVAGELRADSSKKLLVRGHSDAMGSPEYKKALSQRRAATVQGFLIAHGAPADRVSIEAASDTDPADPGNNPVAWAKNRRVQLLWR